MRKDLWSIGALLVLSLVAGCSRGGAGSTAAPTHMPQPTDTPVPAATPEEMASGAEPACPPASEEGTVSPAVSIYSITFVVNGFEQVLRGGDSLQAVPGDQVQVREVNICAQPFSGNGGEVCVDFAPLDQNGEEILSDNGGTHMVWVAPGFTSLSGPDHTWTIGENWQGISAVLNHWPPSRSTLDVACGGGRCESDDRVLIVFR